MQEWVSYIWVALGVFWFISSRRVKTAAQSQTTASRYATLLGLAAGFILLFSESARQGVLAERVAVSSTLVERAGLVLTFAGVAFAVWARRHLGRNWSGAATIKHDHELVGSGPYRFVRHPIYSGAILACVGTAMVAGDVSAFLGMAIVTSIWLLKMQFEEALLTRQFGTRYEAYRRQVSALIPFLL